MPGKVGSRCHGKPAPGAVDTEAVRADNPYTFSGYFLNFLFESNSLGVPRLFKTGGNDFRSGRTFQPTCLQNFRYLVRCDDNDCKVNCFGDFIDTFIYFEVTE